MLLRQALREVQTACTEHEHFFHWPCRYGGMFVIGMAYRGTANNSMIQKLLHFAVSDVSDDVRRAAVINLGFLLLSVPDQCPPIVALLAESYNAHVRYGGCPWPCLAPQQHPQSGCRWRHHSLRTREHPQFLALILVVSTTPYPALRMSGLIDHCLDCCSRVRCRRLSIYVMLCLDGSAGSDGRLHNTLKACGLA